MSRRLCLTVLIGCLMLVLPWSPSAAAPQASTIIVNSTADDPTGCPKTCTLRGAIATANPGDVIEFDPAVTETIMLTQTLVIDKDLTINGPGADVLALDGVQQIRVLEIQEETTVSIAGLAIQNGSSVESGGGILNLGTLTVTASTFTNNGTTHYGGGIDNVGNLTVTGSTFSANSAAWSGGGIHNYEGTLTVMDSTFSGNAAIGNYTCGGGIYNEGTLTVVDSTFSNNSSGLSGGGINNTGDLTVTNSTFSSNMAVGGGGINNERSLTVRDSTFSRNAAAYGGGIDNFSNLIVTGSTFSANSASWGGGGIHNYEGRLTVTNSTFSRNAAGSGGGIDSYGDTLIVEDSTFSGNAANFGGGGFYIRGSLALRGTIVAGNTSDISGEVHSLGYNLIGNPDGATGFLASDLQNVAPLLGPLADNGGSTQTMALLEGSPAIDAIPAEYCVWDHDNNPDTDPMPLATDQRDEPRVGTCDIGAYEFDGVVPEE